MVFLSSVGGGGAPVLAHLPSHAGAPSGQPRPRGHAWASRGSKTTALPAGSLLTRALSESPPLSGHSPDTGRTRGTQLRDPAPRPRRHPHNVGASGTLRSRLSAYVVLAGP